MTSKQLERKMMSAEETVLNTMNNDHFSNLKDKNNGNL